MDLFDIDNKHKISQTNAPELSVSDLAGAIKHTIEGAFERVRVRGELSKVARPASGHIYTTLKDDNAVIDAVCWRTQIARLRVKPEEGLEVIVTGRVTTYPARSSYQLIIEQIELAGIGAILKMIEDRRIKLAAEGLFDEGRKRALPFAPRTIGVITSPTGAVIRDILHRLADRFPVRVIVWPVAVQGDNAAVEVTRAIAGFNALPVTGGPVPRPDVLIVARGGGSIEDLIPFNDEALVRAAAASTIPLISAVGHETDTTLIDYASDKRAPTPTAAAEFAVPVRDELMGLVHDLSHRLGQGFTRHIRELRGRLSTVSAYLTRPDHMINLPAQRFDHTVMRFDRAMGTRFDQLKSRLNEQGARLRHPARVIDENARLLSVHTGALMRTGNMLLRDPQKRLDHLGQMLDMLSFHHVLNRGFALVRDKNGDIIRSSNAVSTGDMVRILFADKIEKNAEIQR